VVFLSKVQLIGHTTKARINNAAGSPMGIFSIRTVRSNGAEDWYNCQIFGKMAESLDIGEGDLVYVEGQLRTNKIGGGSMYYSIHVEQVKILLKKQ
jgi:single-stranded DNA-binding protein